MKEAKELKTNYDNEKYRHQLTQKQQYEQRIGYLMKINEINELRLNIQDELKKS